MSVPWPYSSAGRVRRPSVVRLPKVACRKRAWSRPARTRCTSTRYASSSPVFTRTRVRSQRQPSTRPGEEAQIPRTSSPSSHQRVSLAAVAWSRPSTQTVLWLAVRRYHSAWAESQPP